MLLILMFSCASAVGLVGSLSFCDSHQLGCEVVSVRFCLVCAEAAPQTI